MATKRNLFAYGFSMFALLLTLGFGNMTLDSFNSDGFSIRTILFLFATLMTTLAFEEYITKLKK